MIRMIKIAKNAKRICQNSIVLNQKILIGENYFASALYLIPMYPIGI